MRNVIILGGGPAGLGAAYRLERDGVAHATVLERAPGFGGNAGSFVWNGHHLDFGSHRLHPACDADVLADIRELLGDGLLDRPRHGRIRLLGRWVHFPLKPLDLLLHVHPSFAAGSLWDATTKPLRGGPPDGADESFGTVLQRSLGSTICRHFYFPYARKIWGRAPEELSAIQARRRVSASSISKLLRKVLSQVPGLKPEGAGRFFYPRTGFGGISDAYAEAAARHGATLLTGHTVTSVARPEGPGSPWRVVAEADGRSLELEGDDVWSTIPVTVLARLLRPAAPDDVLAAIEQIRYRAMVLVYLELDVDRFTEYDAHYFPGADVRITRLSEPKNYAARTEPRGRTVLCAELPCDTGDAHWEASDDDLGRLVADDLARSGLPLSRPPVSVMAKRLSHAYPIYLSGYEAPLATIDTYVSGIDRLLSYGRQGLFAHDNTHHALYMAYAAVDCMDGDGFDTARWAGYREEFEGHVVED